MIGTEYEVLTETGKRHLWLSFGRDGSHFDRQGAIVASAEGCYITDVQGNRYLDAMGGQGAATVGYGHPRLLEAIARQQQILSTNPSGFPATIPAIRLAEKLANLTPGSLGKTFFTNSGSEANETAMKIARQYHKLRGNGGKYKAITRRGGYHGSTLGTNAVSGYTFRRRAFEPLPQGAVHIDPPYCYRCPYRLSYPSCQVACADELRRIVEFEDPSTVACFIGELTMSGGGMIIPPREYVQMIRAICDEHDMLMIADEVVTGFGKTGYWFEIEDYGVVPDILVLGKGISGGVAPLAAAVVRSEIADLFSGSVERCFQHGYTSAGNPVSCAAGLATMAIMEEEALVPEVVRKSELARQRLEQIRRSTAIVGDIRQKGFMIGIELVKDPATGERFENPLAVRDFLVAAGKRHGVHLFGLGPIILIHPSLTITDQELDILFDAIGATIADVQRKFA